MSGTAGRPSSTEIYHIMMRGSRWNSHRLLFDMPAGALILTIVRPGLQSGRPIPLLTFFLKHGGDIPAAADKYFFGEDGAGKADGAADQNVREEVGAHHNAADGHRPGEENGKEPERGFFLPVLDFQNVRHRGEIEGGGGASGVSAGEGFESVRCAEGRLHPFLIRLPAGNIPAGKAAEIVYGIHGSEAHTPEGSFQNLHDRHRQKDCAHRDEGEFQELFEALIGEMICRHRAEEGGQQSQKDDDAPNIRGSAVGQVEVAENIIKELAVPHGV